MHKHLQRILFSAFIVFLTLLNCPAAFAASTIGDHVGWSVNRLGELERYVTRWKSYIADELIAHPIPDLANINVPFAERDRITFSELRIINGVMTITLNDSFGLNYLDEQTITLTPITADIDPVDGYNETITGWTCTTTIPSIYKWNREYFILDELGSDEFLNCLHNQ